MKVLLVGHACGPGLGSEPGFTWNWAQSLSAQHRIWVIAYPQHRAAVEQWLRENPNPNLQFVWVVTNHPLDPWKPERGDRGIRIHYMLWVAAAYREARRLCHEVSIDLVHHVSLGTVGAPPPLWKLPVPAIWGPIGGGQTTDPRYLSFYGKQRWAERVRTARVKFLRRSRSLRKTAQNCQVIFATNRETGELLKGVRAPRVEILLDGGLPVGYVSPTLPSFTGDPNRLTLLWAGRLEHRKGLALGLKALASVKKSTSVTLLVAGSGPQENELKLLSQELGLEGRVTFLGSVPYAQMPALFRSASAFLFTSLRDSFGSVVLEAMAHAVPILTLDHQGVGTFVPREAAMKIPVADPAATIQGVASAIEELASNPGRLLAMREAAWKFARQQTWDERAGRMSDWYERVLEASGKPIRANSNALSA